MSYMRPGHLRRFFKGTCKEFVYLVDDRVITGFGSQVDGEDMAEIVTQMILSAGIITRKQEKGAVKKLAKEFGVEKVLLKKPLTLIEWFEKDWKHMERLAKQFLKEIRQGSDVEREFLRRYGHRQPKWRDMHETR